MEALSRGASEVTTVEQDRQAQKSIVANERELGVSLGLRELSVEAFLESDTKSYDIIFLDPPYAAFSDDIALEAASHLDDEGVLIISCSASQALPEGLGTASIVKARTYDDTQLAYYKKPAK
jgi:16S rRNA (guanine966-N2)-methyltransferase